MLWFVHAGRSVEIPWPVPVVSGGAEESEATADHMHFDGYKKLLDMSAYQLQFHALHGPGPCNMLAVLKEKKKAE